MRIHKNFSYFYMCTFMKSLKKKKKKLEIKYNKQNCLFFFEKWYITQIKYTERGICFDFWKCMYFSLMKILLTETDNGFYRLDMNWSFVFILLIFFSNHRIPQEVVKP